MSEEFFQIYDRVIKDGGDYTFRGQVVAIFQKRSGAVRYVVENDDGILHIFSAANLTLISRHEPRCDKIEKVLRKKRIEDKMGEKLP